MKKLLLSAVAMIGLMPGFTSTASADLIAEDRSGWTIYGCSNETNEGAGLGTLVAMKDGNTSTYWHSCWSVSHNAQNHYFVVDRGEDLASTALDAIGYTPRQNDGGGNGYVTACDIYVLDDINGLSVYSNTNAGVAEGGHGSLSTFLEGKTLTAQGTFSYVYNDPSNRAESKVQFEAPVAGRYILFVATATSGSQGDNFANCAEFNAYIEVADITYSDVTFNFPAYGEDSFSLTVNAMDGSDAAKLIPAVDFFTNAAIEGENTIVSPENNTFSVTGTWEFPFTADQVYRIDIRMKSAAHGCSNLFYNASDKKIQTRNGTDADAFVPERLFYLNTNGFDANGHLKATLHAIATDATEGFQVAADNNAVGSVSSTPTEFLVVSNGSANGTNGAGISLRHPGNNISHINDISGNLGIWSDGNSQDDGGSFLRFFSIEDDLTQLSDLIGDDAELDAAKANPTSANVRAFFATTLEYIDAKKAIENAEALVAMGIPTVESVTAWQQVMGTISTKADVTEEKYNEIITAYQNLVVSSANTAGDAYITLASFQVPTDLMCVRYGDDLNPFVGRYGNDVNGDKTTWKVVAAEGGFKLYNEYSASYLKFPTQDYSNSTVVISAEEASTFVLTLHNPLTAQYGVKCIEETGDHPYLHTNSNHTVVRWEAGDNSSWYLASVDAETAGNDAAVGLAGAKEVAESIIGHVGENVCQYLPTEETEALIEALEAAEGTTAIYAAVKALKTNLTEIGINMPEDGKMYVLRGAIGGFYAVANSETGQLAMSENVSNNNAAVFKFEAVDGAADTFLLINDKYPTSIFSGTHSLAVPAGEAEVSEHFTFLPSEGGVLGAFTVKSNYSGSKYLVNWYDNGTSPRVDRQAAYDNKCDWVLEEVTDPNNFTEIEEVEVASSAPAVQGIYDLQGRKLSAPVKGINIINGKKVLVK